MNTGDLLHELQGHCTPGSKVSWSLDGGLVATGGSDAGVRVWDATTGAVVCVLRDDDHDHPRPIGTEVRCVAWSPDGSMLASGSTDTTAKIWYTATGTVKYTLQGSVHPARKHTLQGTEVMSVAWSPDGRFLATGHLGGTVSVWGVYTGTRLRVIKCGSFSTVWSVAWSPCGSVLLVAQSTAVTIFSVSECCKRSP